MNFNLNNFHSATQFEQEALNIHNRYRAIHNSPAMTLNCQMSRDAAAYAQNLAEMDTLVKSSYTERPEQGENLSLGCYKDREETAEEAVKMWYVNVILTNWQSPLSVQLCFRRDPWHLSKTFSALCLTTGESIVPVSHQTRGFEKFDNPFCL